MPKSATQIAQETFDRESAESRLHHMHKTFAEKYAPADHRECDVFHADLAILLREMQLDALKPFHEAAAAQLSMLAPPPVVLKNTYHE